MALSILIALALVLALGLSTGYISGNAAHTATVSITSTGGSGLQSSTLPLSISNTDPLGKVAITTASTFNFYTPSGGYVATATTSGGVATTTGVTFTSGASYWANINTTGYVNEWIPFTVPYTTSVSPSTIPVAFYQIPQNSYVFTALIGTTTVTNGTSNIPFRYNYNLTSAASQKMTVSFSYKSSDAGYLNCNAAQTYQYDIINSVCQSAVLQISDNSTSLAIGGMPHAYSSGSTRYWWAILPDGVGVANPSNGGMGLLNQFQAPGAGLPQGRSDPNTGGSLTEVTIGNNIYGGTATATLQVGPGALSSGNTEALVFTLIVNADPNYYPTHLSLGPNAINASTPFTVDFKA